MADLERRVNALEGWVAEHAAVERVEHLWLYGLMGYARAIIVGLCIAIAVMLAFG